MEITYYIYIVENNGYAMGTSVKRSSMNVEFYKRGDVIPGVKFHGNVNCTLGYINDKEEDIALPAIEIWNIIATEYKERND